MRITRAVDLQILDDILIGRGGFGHRQHLELAWQYLQRYPLEEASSAMVVAIQHVARRHGAERKYHETMTRAWLHFVAVHDQRWPADSFDQFLERNPDLLDRDLIGHFYSRDLILSDRARLAWIDPDRRRLPALAQAS
ncbi:MAG: hypothetical protein WAL63_11630 [Solirubrobacteraceae bacterium]